VPRRLDQQSRVNPSASTYCSLILSRSKSQPHFLHRRAQPHSPQHLLRLCTLLDAPRRDRPRFFGRETKQAPQAPPPGTALALSPQAYVVGNTLSSIPYLLIISLVPGAIAYYLVQKNFQHFAYFAQLLFACMMLVESLMMIVASIAPDFLMGIITGARIQGVMILGGDFFRLPDDLPKTFWRYPLHYVMSQILSTILRIKFYG
jgi:hypothetical protein